jgi:uncharacterized membrane protein YeaQ/YmgE (transglycosylase-associated protein family)
VHASGIIGIVVSGLFVGALGRLVIPGYQPLGCLLTILIGVIGAAVGYWLGHNKLDLSAWPTFAIQIGIAAALAALFSGLTYRTRPPPR